MKAASAEMLNGIIGNVLPASTPDLTEETPKSKN
jgi:hypothetical protein